MIRDEFKDVKVVSSKKEIKKKKMGERNYYAVQIPKLMELNKAVSLSTIISSVMLFVCFALSLVLFIFSRGTESEYSLTRFIIWCSVAGIVAIWNVVWFAFLKRKNQREIDFSRKELERINRENVQRQLRK